MKKFLYSAAAIVTIAACSKEIDQPTSQIPENGETVTITTVVPVLKSTESDAVFSWTSTEQISVGTTGEDYVTFDVDEAENGTFRHTFEGTAPELLMAVSPVQTNAAYIGNVSLYDVELPSVYNNYVQGTTNALMIGSPDSQIANRFIFRHAAALVKITYANVPVGTTAFVLEADKNITGTVTLEGLGINDIEIANDNKDLGGSKVRVNLPSDVTEANSTLSFYVPVPTGDYSRLKIYLVDSKEKISATEKTMDRSGKAPLTLARGDVFTFPTITLAPVVDPHADDEGWFLVKDVNYLKAGDVIRIASTSNNVLAGLKGTEKFLSSVDASFDTDNESISGVKAGLTNITLGGTEGAWTFNSSEGYYYSDAAKTIKVSDTAEGTWSISIASDGSATIEAGSAGHILYNVTSPRFVTYTSDPQSNMLLPEIYKKYGNPQDSGIKENQTLSFSPTSAVATIGIAFNGPVLNGVQSTGNQTWSSTDESVATVDNNGGVTLVAAGTTTIKVVVDADENYNSASAQYELTVNPAPSGDVWVKVTNANDLVEGMEILITNGDGSFALGEQNTNNRGQVEMTDVPNLGISAGDDAPQVITLESSGENWMLNVRADQYLYAASSSSNHLKTSTKTDVGDNGVFAITINGETGVATIKAQGENTHNWLRYNSTNSIFSCYAFGQGDVAIYRNPNQVIRTLESISVTTNPSKTTYTYGESFDPDGMVVTATYSNGDTEEATNYTYSPSGALTPSNNKITVSYKGKTATIQITVNKANPTLVVSPASPITLNLGATQQLTVDGTDGSISYVSSDKSTVSVSTTGLLKGEAVGSATITINAAASDNYNAASTTVSVTVEDNGITTLWDDDFSNANNAGGTTAASSWSGSKTGFTGDYSVANVYPCQGYLKFAGSKNKGSIETPALSINGSVSLTVSVKLCSWGTDNTAIRISCTNGTASISSFSPSHSSSVTNSAPATWDECTFTVSNATNGFKIKFESPTSGKRFFMDDLLIETN